MTIGCTWQILENSARKLLILDGMENIWTGIKDGFSNVKAKFNRRGSRKETNVPSSLVFRRVFAHASKQRAKRVRTEIRRNPGTSASFLIPESRLPDIDPSIGKSEKLK